MHLPVSFIRLLTFMAKFTTMLPERDKIQQQVSEALESGFVAPLRNRWETHRQLVDQYLTLIRKHLSYPADASVWEGRLSNMRIELSGLLSRQVRPDTSPNYREEFSDYLEASASYAAFFPPATRSVQPESALRLNKDDRVLVKTRKVIHIIRHKVVRAPGMTMNLIRRMAGRPVKDIEPLRRSVPVRNIILKYGMVTVPEELNLVLVKAVLERIRREVALLREIDQLFERMPERDAPEKIHREIQSMIALLRREKHFPFGEFVRRVLENTSHELDTALRKAGSPELSRRPFHPRRGRKEMLKVEEDYRRISLDENLKVLGMLDEWQARVSLHTFSETVRKNSEAVSRTVRNKIRISYLEKVESILRMLRSVSATIEENPGNREILTLLAGKLAYIRQELVATRIPDACNILGDSEVIVKIQDLLGLTVEAVNQLPERLFVLPGVKKNGDLVTMKDMADVQLGHLVELDSLPPVQAALSALRAKVEETIDLAIEQLNETGRIAEYNLDSALSLAQTEGDFGHAREVALEGLGRSIARAGEVNDALIKVSEQFEHDILSTSGILTSRLFSYMERDRLLDAKTRIQKAKAIRRSEMAWQTLKAFAAQTANKSWEFLKAIAVYTGEKYQSAREKLGLEQRKTLVSPEISDFLAETQKAISRLPYVYQRLFVLAPLTDENFFRGRATELSRMTEAWHNWKAGRYAPTLITGETGSGSTSLVNLFCSTHLTEETIYRYEVEKPVSQEREFLLFMASLFDTEFTSREEMFLHFNALPGRPVIVVEGIHHLFLRTINGFAAVKLFAELMSVTNRNVFWMATANLYGWQYLDRMLQISDFFGYIIPMETLSDQEIVDVILRRHIASGYKLKFELPEGEKTSAKPDRFRHPGDQQQYLKSMYFKTLNEFARSNIAISMLLWLRSAQDIRGNELTIALPKGLNVTFIKTLARDKIFFLQALLVHDGLPEDKIASVLNFSRERSRLLTIQLYDDGIIVIKKDLYVINPLLYRQVVSTLKSLNLIH